MVLYKQHNFISEGMRQRRKSQAQNQKKKKQTNKDQSRYKSKTTLKNRKNQ